MAKIECSVEETYLENDNGIEVESVIVTCSKCGREAENFGTSKASINRCFAILFEKCPNNERNFYTEN